MTRVTLFATPWPERNGARGAIVAAPAGYYRYPWAGLGKRDVVVLLDDDPLVHPERRPDPANYGGQGWTCVVDIGCVAFEAVVG